MLQLGVVAGLLSCTVSLSVLEDIQSLPKPARVDFQCRCSVMEEINGM